MRDLRDLLPVEGEHVHLRALAEKDADAYALGTKDPAVREFGHLPEPDYTPELVRELAGTVVVDGLRKGELAVLTIADRATDAFHGSLVIFDVTEHDAEVGFWLAPQARGRGLAREALALAARLAAQAGWSSLRAVTSLANTASARTLAGAGFTPVGDPGPMRAPSGAELTAQRYELRIADHHAART